MAKCAAHWWSSIGRNVRPYVANAPNRTLTGTLRRALYFLLVIVVVGNLPTLLFDDSAAGESLRPGKQPGTEPQLISPAEYIRIKNATKDADFVVLSPESSSVYHVSGWRLAGVFKRKLSVFWVPVNDGHLWYDGQISSDLRVADFSIRADSLTSLPERPKQKADSYGANQETEATYDSAGESPKGHILLGLQVLIGCIFICVGFYCGRKAFSAELSRYTRDGAFIGYLFAGMSLIVVGCFLILAIGLTVSIIEGP